MKILFYTRYVPEGTDGVSIASRGLVSTLMHKGLDVTVCTTNPGWTEKEIQKQSSKKLRIFKAWSSSGADFSPGLFTYLSENARNFDIIQLEGTFNLPTVWGAYTAKAARIPYIICPRGNLIPSTMTHKHIRNAMRKRIYFLLLARKAMRNASWIVCSSEMEQEATLKQIRTDNVSYINNGLDISSYIKSVNHAILKDKLGIDPERPLFLFLGRLVTEKAIPFLLGVWDLVIKNVPNALLVIAGANDSNRELQKKLVNHIATLRRPDSILMPGAVIGDLKLALLQYSRCLLLPSYYESFGNVVLESLASGTPVIASIGTPWKVLEEKHFGKWLPWDVKAWAESIMDISVNGAYKDEAFSVRSRQWVIDNFNWSTIADKYIELYENIKHDKKTIRLPGL